MIIPTRILFLVCAALIGSAHGAPVNSKVCNGKQTTGLHGCHPLYSNNQVKNIENHHNPLKLLDRDSNGDNEDTGSRAYFSNGGGARPFKRQEDREGSEREDSTGSAAYFSNGGGARPFKRQEGEGEREDTGSAAFFSHGGGGRPFRREEEAEEDTGSKAYFSNGGGARPFKREDGEEDTGSRAYFSNGGGARPFKRQDEDQGADDTGSKAYFSNDGGAKPFRRQEEETGDHYAPTERRELDGRAVGVPKGGNTSQKDEGEKEDTGSKAFFNAGSRGKPW